MPQGDVVVLDQDRIEQPGAMVRPAAASDRVLLQLTKSGRSLARVKQNRAGAIEFHGAARCQSGDPGEPSEQVQGSPLAGENRSSRAGDMGQLHRHLVRMVAVGVSGRDDYPRIKRGKDRGHDAKPTHDARLLL